MDNIYGKKLPGTTLPSASGSDYLLAETNDGKLNWVDSTGSKELADKPWANSTFLTPSDAETSYLTKTDASTTYLSKTDASDTYVPMQFTDASGAINYIGKDVGSLSLSSGTHVFTNCRGSVTYNPNTAKVYSSSSPNLYVLDMRVDETTLKYRGSLDAYFPGIKQLTPARMLTLESGLYFAGQGWYFPNGATTTTLMEYSTLLCLNGSFTNDKTFLAFRHGGGAIFEYSFNGTTLSFYGEVQFK